MTSPADVGRHMRAARRRVVLAVAIVASLALLCCGGSVSAFFLGGLDGETANPFNAAFDCGGKPIKHANLPNVRAYNQRQMGYALTIIQTGDELNVPVKGWVVAIAVALTESNLKMYANPAVPRSMQLPHDAVGKDHDSVGLFQQRPGWGSPEELMDAKISATKFYNALQKVDKWLEMPLTEAAQEVQVSAYPNAYASREPVATEIVNLLSEGSARVQIGEDSGAGCTPTGEIASSGWTAPVPEGVVSGFRTASRTRHHGVDLGSARRVPIKAAAAGVVSVVKCDEDFRGWQTCFEDGWPGKGGCGWMVEIVHADRIMTRYCHLLVPPKVRVGQRVNAGEEIGIVGTSGNSSGPHLHFEVHLNNDRSSNGAVDPVKFMRDRGAPLGGKAS
jgi:murein DD-endopeptidase MepM/ murein hydrolase activator NlpD